ncbi:MAG TPA: tail fiber domain-containing protein [Thermoanaerobaculia bacterium]
MRFTPRFSVPVIVAALFPLISLAAEASRQPAGMRIANPTTVEWAADHAGALLSVQRPDGEVFTEAFPAGRSPMLRLDGMADGAYSWELRAGMDVQSGSFTVANGAIVPPDVPETLRAGARPLRPATETYFADDVSAAGGVCAGVDCTNAESYGVATIKMKENNTRLKFEDTSTSAGFATTDWQISANDMSSGGANKLYVEDLTAATVPFLIEGGTPTNTLYVDSNGRVGVRTSTPARDLTIANPVSVGIRMEQSASPFQAWDIVANNNNFYVRDVNHEQNPFIIKSSAPYNALVIESTSGNIGLGVASPLYQVHHSSGARLDAGNWTNASSRGVKQDIHALDRDAAFDALRALQPMTYAYKANPKDTQVGFIAEDVPELVATPDRKGLSSMDIVAVLTKVIQEQQKTIEEMRGRLERLEERE